MEADVSVVMKEEMQRSVLTFSFPLFVNHAHACVSESSRFAKREDEMALEEEKRHEEEKRRRKREREMRERQGI